MPISAAVRLRSQYAASEMTNGSIDVFIIPGMLSTTFVFVRSATRSALVETGEHLSPKNMPESTAPPESIGLMPMAFAIVIQITPIVAALPNDVPVRKEINELMTKTAARNHWDLIIGRA